MKILRLITIVLCLSVAAIASEVSIEYFSTRSDGSNVNIEWRCSAEKSVARYEIERSTDGQNFRSIGTAEVRGAFQTYHFTDQDVLLKNGDEQKRISLTNYTYRLKIVGTDNTVSYSNISSVIHNISSVRRTWGMIKEMFK